MSSLLRFVLLPLAVSLTCAIPDRTSAARAASAETRASTDSCAVSEKTGKSAGRPTSNLGGAIRALLHVVAPVLGTGSCASAESAPAKAAQPASTATGNSPADVKPPKQVPGKPADPEHIPWMTDYTHAMDTAWKQGKMMLILFHRPGKCELADQFEAEALGDVVVRKGLQAMAPVKVPLDAKITIGGKEVELLKHSAFAEMLGLPGLAMVDFAQKDPTINGQVVSVFPFLDGRTYTTDEVKVMLSLPPGTLTQRTLIYAVRTHPERPASANGKLDVTLLHEAQSHSDYQARIHRQGHHFWEHRFHRINARLPGGCLAYEVCAESWPGQGLLHAAIECVRCWRLSSGHWRSVHSPCQAYGYDMKRGANGIWYATGIFGR